MADLLLMMERPIMLDDLDDYYPDPDSWLEDRYEGIYDLDDDPFDPFHDDDLEFDDDV